MASAAADARPDLAAVRARYLEAQLHGNRREALRLVIDEAFARGASALEVELEVIQEAQREIGRLWQENSITIAEEHMATAISNLALAHLYDHAPRERSNGKKVVVACVEGELHDFPARLVADALDLAGFDVRYLGANVPTDSLLAVLDREKPDLLALSVTMTFNVPALRNATARVREHTADSLPIAMGGGALSWMNALATELHADVTACDARELVESARRLLGVGP
jgi:methanogenic corrinoid protein MtbC1